MGNTDPRKHWDDQASSYATGAGGRRFGRFLELYEEACWQYIRGVLPEVEGSLVLEAGCGTGRWVERLAPMGYQLILSDLSPEMIRHARSRIERLGWSDWVQAYHVLDICDLRGLADASFDLVLALGGPLSLYSDALRAATELRRVTRSGGYVICDAANRYRTALDLVRGGNVDQLATVLDTRLFSRPDGLADHRFTPEELRGLFEAQVMEVVCLAAVCPLLDFLPSEQQVASLDNEETYASMQDIGHRYAEDPAMVAVSGRLLIVSRRR